MNKRLFEFCQRHLRLIDSGKFKASSLFQTLAQQYDIGRIEQGFFYFNTQDKQRLIALVQQENNLLLSDVYPEKLARVDNAARNRNEKQGALSVTHDCVLLNTLQSLRLNQQCTDISAISGLGYYCSSTAINSVEHKQIILVENLAVMRNLARLNLCREVQDPLWLYRGDQKKQQNTGSANTFFRRFKDTQQLICFSDFDPAGLQIALSCGATHWLTLAQPEAVNMAIAGVENEWYKQHNEKQFIALNSDLSAPVLALFDTMRQHKKTLKQEHMLAYGLALSLYALY